MNAETRAFVAYLAAQLRDAVGKGTGKRERKILKVVKALEEIICK